MECRIQGEPLVPGTIEGRILVSHEPLSFWGGYNPETGEIIDRRHPLSGMKGKGCILAIPGTRGSSTTTAVLLEAVRLGNAPAGFIVTDRDTFLALAAVVADEMYQHILPVVQVELDQFRRLQSGQAGLIRGWLSARYDYFRMRNFT